VIKNITICKRAEKSGDSINRTSLKEVMSKTTRSLPKALLPFLWHFVKEQWLWILAAQIFALAWSIDHTIWPYAVMLLIDGIINFTGDKADMWQVLAFPIWLGAGLWVGIEVFNRLSGYIMAYRVPKFEASIRMGMFDYVQRHSYSYFCDRFAGSIANKIADMPKSANYLIEQMMRVFIPVLVAFIISMGMFAHLHPLFAVILMVWFVTHISICLLFARKCDQYADIHAESRSALSGAIVDSLTNHLNSKLFSRFALENREIGKFQKDEIGKHRHSLLYMENIKIALGICAFLGPGVSMNWLMLYEWQHDRLTTGEVVFIFNTVWNMTFMAWVTGLEMPSFFREIGVCRQALSLMQDVHGVPDQPNSRPMHIDRGEILFDKVSFQYSPNHRIFEDKTVAIPAGQKVGLVGFSGSGKTTFVHLILRYFDVNKGRILIDGQDTAGVLQESLRSKIAMIPQDTSLYHRSLLENIRCGRPDASDDEVIEAAKQARCHEFIEKLPERYQTLVGERGIKLSGGQRQRIAIARAFLKNAPILILDEATSALDSVTEQHIQDSLTSLMDGRTAIVIAHRLSTLSNMDRILVFKDGKIVEEGSHQELIDVQGHYAAMWQMQAGGFLPSDLDEEE
jgi:ATP-binding cassette, subfamily B, bacterial